MSKHADSEKIAVKKSSVDLNDVRVDTANNSEELRDSTFDESRKTETKPQSMLMLKMLAKISKAPALTSSITSSIPDRVPFSDPININDHYYSIINEITDYSKRLNFKEPERIAQLESMPAMSSSMTQYDISSEEGGTAISMESGRKLPEVVHKKAANVAFKSSFGPHTLLKEDVNKAVNRVVPNVMTYDGANLFQTKVMNESLLSELTNEKKMSQAIKDMQVPT